MHVANNRGRGLKQLAFRHLPLFKHPFCRYCPNKHRCLKTGAYGIKGGLYKNGTRASHERCSTHSLLVSHVWQPSLCEEAKLQTVVRNSTACCDGFTTRQRHNEDFQLVYYHRLNEILDCPVGMQTQPPTQAIQEKHISQ